MPHPVRFALLASTALAGLGLASPAFAQGAGIACPVTIAADPGTSAAGVTGGAGTLSYALAYANSVATPVTIDRQTNVTVAGPLSPIFASLTINGNGNTISGSGSQRIFFVGTDEATRASAAVSGSMVANRQQVAINTVTLANGLAQGGNSGKSTGGGGLGAGRSAACGGGRVVEGSGLRS